VRYETNLDPHDHFHCRLCLRLFDVELGGRELVDRPLPGYAIETVAVRADGICAECRDYERGLSAGAAHVRRRPTVDESAAGELTSTTVETPLGMLALAASAGGVARIAFEDHADFPLLAERARSRRGPVAGRRRATQVASTLARYFDGFRGSGQDEVDWRFCTPPTVTALMSVHEIPYGEPRSYERLEGGLSAFDCGYAMGSNPLALLIPCHRVTRGSHRPDVYVGGPRRLHIVQELEAG
jgi:AraC family transcriptional regulator of adaptative response/methylated-DNA-[protein]-cysteine methyltransferase